jgi:hypothetical protein
VQLGRVVTLVFVAGCRLGFDAVDDAAVATVDMPVALDPDAVLERCGAGVILCDDFESDAFDPWLRDISGGSIVVEPGCGAGASRCAHSIHMAANEGARFGYEIFDSRPTLQITGTVIPRVLGGGDSQLLAFDFRDGAALVTQVGASTHEGALTLYEFNFVTMTVTLEQTVSLPSVDVPMTLSLSIDHVAKTATLDRADVRIATLVLSPEFAVPTTSKALVGLWCTVPDQIYDFDNVIVE